MNIWNIIGAVIAGLALFISWRGSQRTESKDETDAKIKLAVLEERLQTEISLLSKLETKIEEIVKELK